MEKGHAEAFVRSYMNGLISFQRIMQKTTETVPLDLTQ